jgi:type I restriction enzyme M protein
MNMIMHGDGHGGVHHHDGFINVNGIFEKRFDIVLTNPPFGANVEQSDVVLDSDVSVPEEVEERYISEYGNLYKQAIDRVRAAKKKPITSLFDLPKKSGRIKTEILFIERCLALLKPGGRMGIVLPEGIFNNPSLAYVREYVEDRAFIRAVISLPQETFYSAGTSVKASLLFLQKFTEQEQVAFDKKKAQSRIEIEEKFQDEMAKHLASLEFEIKIEKSDKQRRVGLTKQRKSYQRKMSLKIDREARTLLKERFDYPIFLYDSEKVGITATGEEDQNELYPNPNIPPGIQETALELYRAFRKSPGEFLLEGALA